MTMYYHNIVVFLMREGDLSRAIRRLNKTRFGVYHSLYEWFNPLWLQDKQSNLTTRTFVTEKVLPELYELVILLMVIVCVYSNINYHIIYILK